MNRKIRCQKPGFEPLEQRIPLAGDVSISTLGGNLQIIGDSGDNHFTVQQIATGQFRITGNGGERFQYNGRYSAGPVDVRMVTGGILISTGAGADTVKMEGLTGNAPAGNFLTIVTGAGVDRVFVSDLRIGGPEFPARITIPSELNRVSGQIGREATLNAKSAGSLTIDTAYGDLVNDGDQITIEQVQINGPSWIQTGLGNDSVWLDGVTAMQTVINTDRGADRIDLAVDGPVRLAQLKSNLGPDNDNVMIGSSQLQLTSFGTSVIEGGPGTNSFAYLSNVSQISIGTLKNPTTTGFQQVWASPANRFPIASVPTVISAPETTRPALTPVINNSRKRLALLPLRHRLRQIGTR